MYAKFKQNYTTKIWNEDNIQSGDFTFMKDKSYYCEYSGNKLKIWDDDKIIFAKFNKEKIKMYLEEIV